MDSMYQDRGYSKRVEHRRTHYRQFNLIVRRGTLLESLLDRQKERQPLQRRSTETGERSGGLSDFIRNCLCDYLGIDSEEAYFDESTNPQGSPQISSHNLDSILDEAGKLRLLPQGDGEDTATTLAKLNKSQRELEVLQGAIDDAIEELEGLLDNIDKLAEILIKQEVA